MSDGDALPDLEASFELFRSIGDELASAELLSRFATGSRSAAIRSGRASCSRPRARQPSASAATHSWRPTGSASSARSS